MPQETIEQMMIRLDCKGAFISQKTITDRIKDVKYVTTDVFGTKLMYCYFKMDNGFVASGEPSVCIDSSNFRVEIGERVSFENTFSSLFKLEAYRFLSAKEDKIINTARQCHFVLCDYEASIGDESRKPWNEAPERQKEQMIKTVHRFINNPDISAVEAHNQWVMEKKEQGWQHGGEKSESLMTNSNLTGYQNIDTKQRIKLILISTTVKQELKKYD